MPELVEVENYRSLLLSLKSNEGATSPGLLTVKTPSPSAPKIFPSNSELEAVKKCFVKDVARKGKLLRMDLVSSNNTTTTTHLYLHMGMTGRISTPENIPSLESLKIEQEFPPPHTHLILESSEGKRVAFSDPRRFGGISFGEPLSTQWEDFAPDALDPKASFVKLAGCKKGIKALLLDQRAALSGVGNWIADEILYQSEIHPDQNYLTLEEVKVLKQRLDFVLKKGIECLSQKQSFPEDWIFHRRWNKGKKSDNKDAEGRHISFLKSGGRTSAIVPSMQKKQSRKPPEKVFQPEVDQEDHCMIDHEDKKRKTAVVAAKNVDGNQRRSKRLAKK